MLSGVLVEVGFVCGLFVSELVSVVLWICMLRVTCSKALVVWFQNTCIVIT